MLKDLLKHIIDALVEGVDHVVITQKKDGSRHILHIKVDERDLGRVIGRNGKTIRAIRTLVNIVVPEGSVSVDVTQS